MARTTVRALLEYNRDLDPARGLAVGQEVCLLLCSPGQAAATAAGDSAAVR